MVKYFSLFSGIGGFELGIQKALGRKARCVGFSEIDRHAIRVYTQHYPKHKNYGDVTRIAARQLPDFDLLVGGFPCQSFSLAGKRKGFNDPRGQMFFHIARILRAKKPKRFILENVPGLLSHDDGRTFKTIISSLVNLGYSVEWCVLNSQNYGVPQHRKRVFIIGHRRNRRTREVLPLLEPNSIYHKTTASKKGTPIRCVYDGGFINRKIYGVGGSSPTLVASTNSVPVVAITNSATREFNWREDRSPALCANDFKNPKLLGYECLNCKQKRKRHNGKYCRIRKLTPTECEMIQGLPKDWTVSLRDNHRYKSIGNAVTPLVIFSLVRLIVLNKKGPSK